jgi:hypothetical protein
MFLVFMLIVYIYASFSCILSHRDKRQRAPSMFLPVDNLYVFIHVCVCIAWERGFRVAVLEQVEHLPIHFP